MSVSELFRALIPSDDEEDARPSRGYDLTPSSASSDDEEHPPPPPPPRKARKPKKPRTREAELHLLSREELAAAHENVRQRLLARRDEEPWLQVPRPLQSGNEAWDQLRVVKRILKLEQRVAYTPPDRTAEEWGELEPSELAGAPLTLSGRWGSGAALVGTPVPEGGWLVCDLFCSVGGFSSGARALDHKVVLGIDCDEEALKIHALNHPEARHVALKLGPDTEELVLQLIDEAVPASERHRLWLHGSPPCTTQSNMRRLGAASTAEGKRAFAAINDKSKPLSAAEQLAERAKFDAEMRENKDMGLSLVQWTIDLIAKVDPAQHSIEEVSDKKGEVMALMQAAKRAQPQLFDCVVVQMAEFGVPHYRERAICARPATVHALRSRASLRARAPTVRETIGDSLEPEIQYICGTITRPVAEPGTPDYKVRPRPKSNLGLEPVTRLTDGKMDIMSLDKVSNTVCCRAFPLADEKHKVLRYTTPEELRKLTTFPPYTWPANASNERKATGYGNAIPPRFAEAIFKAASPE